MKKVNFARLLKSYKSGWVAISEDFSKVEFWGKTLQGVMKKTKKLKKKTYYFPAGESYGDFVGEN